MSISSGKKISRIARILWYVNLALVIIGVVIVTLVYAESRSYNYYGWNSYSSGDVLGVFLVASLIGAFEIFIAYITRIILEGFGELVSDTREIRKILENREA